MSSSSFFEVEGLKAKYLALQFNFGKDAEGKTKVLPQLALTKVQNLCDYMKSPEQFVEDTSES